MNSLTSNETAVMFLSLGMLLASARFLGEVARRLNQPAVLGELIAGIILGPTVLGAIAPELMQAIFPRTGALPVVREGLTTLAIALFLLVAGMEVELSTVWRQGRTAAAVSAAGILLPFALGFASAYAFPDILDSDAGHPRWLFAVFFATALSISALPVIAKTLMDLDLYRSDMGMIVIAAAVFNDLVGWMVFAVVLGSLGGSAHGAFSPGLTIGLTLGFALITLTLGRWLLHRTLPWFQAHTVWPGGVLGLAVSLALLGAALTEWFGINAIFGSFLVGVAIGDSPHLQERTRSIIGEFVAFIFAPLFFASIGLRVDFAAHFDAKLVGLVLVIACIGKVLGCGLGGRWSGLAWREAWAVGFGLNARGAMEIILGLLALKVGLIRERMFVALVVMALVTSMMSGPAMQRILRLRKPRRFTDHLSSRAFIPRLRATDRQEVIRELAAVLGPPSGMPPEAIAQAVLEREELLATGIGHGVAVPHARMPGLSSPVLGLGIAPGGIDFDSPDGETAQIIFMILTPREDDGAQLNILAEISRLFRDKHVRERLLQVGNYTELLALLNMERSV